MLKTSTVSSEIILVPSQAAQRFRRDEAFDILDRLLSELQLCANTHEQITLVLEAVRAATGADAVLWYPGTTREALRRVGGLQPAPEWFAAFVRHHTVATPGVGSQLSRFSGQLVNDAGTPFPQSVAMVRVSKSRSVWLVAMSFDPLRPLRSADLKFLSLAKRLLLHERQRVRGQEKVEATLIALVRCLTAAIGANDPYTCDHSERVARIAARIGQEMGLSTATCGDLYLAGLLHDIGKIGINTSVLQQEGPLSDEQRAHVAEHPVIGDEIVANVPSLAHLRPAVRNHHERFDGRGYPDSLAGDSIPLLARIMAVADSCDAMFSARPYRPGMAPESVDAILRSGAGVQWDAEVIRHFMACRTELYAIYTKGLGDSMAQAVANVVKVR